MCSRQDNKSELAGWFRTRGPPNWKNYHLVLVSKAHCLKVLLTFLSGYIYGCIAQCEELSWRIELLLFKCFCASERFLLLVQLYGYFSWCFYSAGTGSVRTGLDHSNHLKTTEKKWSTTHLTSHSWSKLMQHKITLLTKVFWHSSGQLVLQFSLQHFSPFDFFPALSSVHAVFP